MKKSIFHFSVLIFLFTLVTACGGGGGDQPSTQITNTSAPAPTTPTVTPPVTTPITPVVTTPVVTPKPTPSELVIKVDATSPVATNILSTDTKYESRAVINIKNPTTADQPITISSVSVKGSLASSIANVQLVSGGKVLGTGVVSGGKAYFSSITLNVLAGTSQKITAQAKLSPSMQPLGSTVWSKKANFGFTVDDIIPSSVPISGLPVWGSYVYVNRGAKYYPCPNAICNADLGTGKKVVPWGQENIMITKIIPTRDGKSIAFTSANIAGLQILSLSTLQENTLTGGSWDNCSTGPGFDDVSEDGTIVALSSGCSKTGYFGTVNVGLIKTGKKGGWIRVTDDSASEFSVAFGSAVNTNSSTITVLYGRNETGVKTNIWKTVVDTSTGKIDSTSMVVDNISGFIAYANAAKRLLTENKIFSVNKDYTKLVFVRKVAGIPHLFITSINGGKQIDVGTGRNPHWGTDGSNRILFIDSGLWMMDGDGTNRRKMIIPDNLIPISTTVPFEEIVLSATYP